MKDPRIILLEELTHGGVPDQIAFTIALDAGSSQVTINK